MSFAKRVNDALTPPPDIFQFDACADCGAEADCMHLDWIEQQHANDAPEISPALEAADALLESGIVRPCYPDGFPADWRDASRDPKYTEAPVMQPRTQLEPNLCSNTALVRELCASQAEAKRLRGLKNEYKAIIDKLCDSGTVARLGESCENARLKARIAELEARPLLFPAAVEVGLTPEVVTLYDARGREIIPIDLPIGETAAFLAVMLGSDVAGDLMNAEENEYGEKVLKLKTAGGGACA